MIAAIVGGGLKAFNIEIPVLTSPVRQAALAVFGLVLLVSAAVASQDPDPNPSSPSPTSETRSPVAAGFGVNINFQSANAEVPQGYLVDFGQPFGQRTGPHQGDGLSYGWVRPGTPTPVDMTAHGRDRGRTPAVSQLLDTVMHFRNDNPATGKIDQASWEIAVPNGEYVVTVSVGDATVAQRHTVIVEGVVAIREFQGVEGKSEYESNTVTVEVADGRLTLDSDGVNSTKINYVEIVQVA